MKRCPLTYELCGEARYTAKGLHRLSKNLQGLQDFPFSAKEQIELALQQADKISIQGVQPKFSTILNVAASRFEIVEKNGTFIFKPPHHLYEQLPENEDVTMRLAQMIDLETPLHGMVHNIDDSFTYFIKRFDRLPKGKKLGVEDFAQLMGLSRDVKYESSMEKMVPVIEQHCTFPALEKIKFFRLVLFNFLIGNEDMHLKNFSLIRREEKVELAPCYDLVNTSIALSNPREEIALPLREKKSRLSREDFFEYWGKERLGININVLQEESRRFEAIVPSWEKQIQESFLSEKFRTRYLSLLRERCARMFF